MNDDDYKPVGRITTDALRAALRRQEFAVISARQVSRCTVRLFTTGVVDFTIKDKTYKMMVREGEITEEMT